MAFQITPDQFILSCISALSVLLLSFVCLHYKARENLPLIFMMVALAVWSLGASAETSLSQPEAKIFWRQVSQAGLMFIPLFWLAVLKGLLEKHTWLNGRMALLLSLVPVVGAALLWTNESHRLFWQTVKTAGDGQHLVVVLGAAGWISLIYNLGLSIASAGIIIRQMASARKEISLKYAALLICTITPIVARLAHLTSGEPGSLTAWSSLIFLFVSFVLILCIYYYRLFGLVSIPAQTIITGMQDGILVLDEERRVIQANPAAEAILRKPAKALLDQKVSNVFSGIEPRSFEKLTRENDFCEAIQLVDDQGVHFYEVRQSQIRERRRFPAGWLLTIRDVTVQVHAETESRRSRQILQQSEEKFRSLVENINEVIFIVEWEGTVSYISPAVEQITGYRADEIIGQPYLQFVHPEDLVKLNPDPLRWIADQQGSIEVRIINRQNAHRYIRVYPHPVWQNGEITALQGVITDITERKQVEEALERRASQLAMLNYIGERIAETIELDSLLSSAVHLIQSHFGYYHVGIFTPDPRWNMLILRADSGAFRGLFPENHRLMLGQGLVGWVAENKTALFSNDVRLEPRHINLYPGKIPTRSELAVPILTGERVLGVLDIQSPMIDAFDENDVRLMKTVAYQVAVAMEKAQLYEEVRLRLKERERSENMLRVQRDLLIRLSPAKSLSETIQVALETFSTELHADQVSISLPGIENRTDANSLNIGYPINPGLLLSAAENNIPTWVISTGKSTIIKNIHTDPRKPDAFPGTLSVLSVPLVSNSRVIGAITLESSRINAFSQEHQHLMITLTNSLVMLIERARLFEEVVTARVELEKRATELQEANTSLREMDRLKSQFLANMSHELRTPLNSIIGFSEVLVDDLIGVLNMEQREAAQDILDSGRHLLEIINDLLDFSRIQAGRMVLERTVFDLDEVLGELGQTIFPLILKKQQTLEFHNQAIGIKLRADRLRIKQVLLNLLGNANKFTGPGGHISIACRLVDGQYLQISICDNGVGIRPEDHQLIFEEFRQVDGSMSREVPGTGLGLAISKKIVEIHQGSIWVDSEPGNGAVFHFQLPLEPRDSLQNERQAP